MYKYCRNQKLLLPECARSRVREFPSQARYSIYVTLVEHSIALSLQYISITEIKQIFSEIGIISAAQYKFMNSALNTKYSTVY